MSNLSKQELEIIKKCITPDLATKLDEIFSAFGLECNEKFLKWVVYDKAWPNTDEYISNLWKEVTGGSPYSKIYYRSKFKTMFDCKPAKQLVFGEADISKVRASKLLNSQSRERYEGTIKRICVICRTAKSVKPHRVISVCDKCKPLQKANFDKAHKYVEQLRTFHKKLGLFHALYIVDTAFSNMVCFSSMPEQQSGVAKLLGTTTTPPSSTPSSAPKIDDDALAKEYNELKSEHDSLQCSLESSCALSDCSVCATLRKTLEQIKLKMETILSETSGVPREERSDICEERCDVCDFVVCECCPDCIEYPCQCCGGCETYPCKCCEWCESYLCQCDGDDDDNDDDDEECDNE